MRDTVRDIKMAAISSKTKQINREEIFRQHADYDIISFTSCISCGFSIHLSGYTTIIVQNNLKTFSKEDLLQTCARNRQPDDKLFIFATKPKVKKSFKHPLETIKLQ